jgi:hypothetical protein
MLVRNWIAVLSLLASGVYAEDLEPDPRLIENTTMISGEIQSINLADRSAIISGTRYHFGPLSGGVVVHMLGRNFGAVELLQTGMSVRVFYIKNFGGRQAKLILQVEEVLRL